MNPIPFLNPYQMAMIDLKYPYTSLYYMKAYPRIYTKIDEYLMDFSLSCYTEKRMPTIQDIDSIYTQVRVMYELVNGTAYDKGKLVACIHKIALDMPFPSDEMIKSAYVHLVTECRDAIRSLHPNMFVDKEKCEVFIRNGWLSEKARYPECITARHEPRYEVFYQEDFSIYKGLTNDCVCP